MAELKDYSGTAGSNNSASPNGWPENMAPSGVNNSDRELAARVARWLSDNNGSLATAGTSTAITVTLNQQFSAWFDGLTFASRITTTCGATPTINPTGSCALGAKSLYWAGSGIQVAAGDLVSTSVAQFMYDATSDKVYVFGAPGLGVIGPASATDNALVRFDSTTGKLIQNSAATLSDAGDLTVASTTAQGGLTINVTNDGAVGVGISTRQISASPAANDALFLFNVGGKDSAGNDETYGQFSCYAADPTNGSEDSFWVFITGVGGAYGNRLLIGGGMYTSGLSDPGAGKFNATEYQVSGRIVEGAFCRGYVTYSAGAPTLADSANVTSITDGGVGALTVTIATDHANANYSVGAISGDATNARQSMWEVTASRAAGSFILHVGDSASADADPDSLSFFTFGDAP